MLINCKDGSIHIFNIYMLISIQIFNFDYKISIPFAYRSIFLREYIEYMLNLLW